MTLMKIGSLLSEFESGELTPTQLVRRLIERWRGFDASENPVWISRVKEEDLMEAACILEERRRNGESLPLYGVPFAVKDNIDVADFETTAGCPTYAYLAQSDAEVVALLRKAGALFVGKTNLDQFATGLVGTRSPYGACHCVGHREYISGGSSSGSAVAVAAGLVAFSIGTDTAGSGRVPAAFNGIVGYKGTRGLVSARGVVPACRSLDCVTVFTADVSGAETVVSVVGRYDAGDPFSRRAIEPEFIPREGGFRFGVLPEEQREFFGDTEAEALYLEGIRRMESACGVAVPVDYRPFQRAAALLYSGPWVAERTAVIEEFLEEHAHEVHPVVRAIIEGGKAYSAVDVFEGIYELNILRQSTAWVWSDVRFLFLPTTPTQYRIDEVYANPVELNSRLGLYTNFVNLMNLAAVAVPLRKRSDGRDYGATLIGPAWSEPELCFRSKRFLGEVTAGTESPDEGSGGLELFVCGAHMRGLPLHQQLHDCGATFLREARTSDAYKLFALVSQPPKPALVRSGLGFGMRVQGEIYWMSHKGLGRLMSQVPAPLGIGTVELENGKWVKGFIGEAIVGETAKDITVVGSWRAYLKAH